MAELPSRKPLRAPSWDYTQPASYMVTICVHDRLHLLGSIGEDGPVLSAAGHMVEEMWRDIPSGFPTIALDAFVVMPNHLHGILHLHHELADTEPCSLADVLKWFKGATTRRYSTGVTEFAWPRYRDRFWQRNYYETIIRDETMLDRFRRYIENNPANWQRDPENILL